MDIKPPSNLSFSAWFSYLCLVCFAIWGGAISYFNRVNKGTIKFTFIRFFIELSTSAFVGIITALICSSIGLNYTMTAAMVGVSGHMGTRALSVLEKRYEDYFGVMNED